MQEPTLKKLLTQKRKQKTTISNIVRLAFLKSIREYQKTDLVIYGRLKEFESFLEFLEKRENKGKK
ncbi:hypothetical protein [Helicobacter cetorum]|uniref:hypothetical protein n=1 Tax=Helicobacter cetorum TaxID=138563 RepID=UPI0013158CBD|nr:hypothetical protein [Helicobacter cetorum]